MSAPPALRRSDKSLSDDDVQDMLQRGYCGRLASVGADGWPYCVPLLYLWRDGELWLHNTAAQGHLKSNILANPNVCFELDEPGEVFPYGRFECDTSIAYRSVIVYGNARIVEDKTEKTRFFAEFLTKYLPNERQKSAERPQGFFPRLDQTTVYAVRVLRITGKQTPLPPPEERWPALDRSASPNAKAPT